MTFDALNDTSSADTNIKVEDFPDTSSLNSSAQLQQLYQFIQEDRDRNTSSPAPSRLPQQQQTSVSTQQYNSSHFDHGYRDLPLDENTSMPFTGLHLQNHNDISLLSPDETTSFILSPATPSRLRPDNDYDNVTVSSLLGQSDRMHITEETTSDPFLDTCSYQPHNEFESPRKISRVVEKLFSDNDDAAQQSDGFMFTKFGVGSSSEKNSSSADQARRSDTEEIMSTCHVESHTSNIQPLRHTNSQQHHQQQHQQQTQQHQQQTHQQLQQQQMMTNEISSNPSHHQQHTMPQSASYNSNLNESYKSIHYSAPHSSRSNRRNVIARAPALSHVFPDSQNGISLKILAQPETQHRARYMTEGSRGSVKDSLQQGHPVVQLQGWDEDARLEMFIGTDTGKLKPHGFYQACRVSGKNSTACKEREVDGTVVIDIDLEKSKNFMATIDCVGILKLRNTDVEKRIGLVKTKKKSTRCRLVFRVNLTLQDGSYLTLQTVSSVINCTQPAGQPEICKMSLDTSPLAGGQELFVIGKNFVKGFTVKFQESDSDSDKILWEKEAEVDSEYTQTSHFICTVPAYGNENVCGPVNAQLIVEAAGGASEPMPFIYNPVTAGQYMSGTASAASCSTPQSTTATNSSHNSPRSFIAPEALELVAQIQQTTSCQSGIFKIPDGVDFISQEQDSLRMNSHSRTSSFTQSDFPDVNDITLANRSSQPMDSGTSYSTMSNHSTERGFLNQQ